MSATDLSELEELVVQGKYQKALDFASVLVEQTTPLDMILAIELVRIEIYIERVRFIEVRKTIDKLLEQSSKYTPSQLIRIYVWNIQLSILLSNDEETLRLIAKVDDLIPLISDDNAISPLEAKVELKRLTGLMYSRKNDFTRALNYFQEMLHLLEEVDNHALYLKCKSDILNVYLEEGIVEEAAELKKEMENQITASNPFQQTRIYFDIISFYETKGDYDAASPYFDKIEQINNSLQSVDITWRFANAKALEHQYKGENAEAKAIHKNNISIMKTLDSEGLLAIAYNNLANIYHLLGDYSLALEYLFLCLSINEELGDQEHISTSYNNIALNYKMKGDLKRALIYQLKSLEIGERLGRQNFLATVYINLGQIYHILEEYDKALTYYTKCLVIDEKTGNKQNIVETLYYLLSLKLDTQFIDEAKTYLNMISEIAEGLNNRIVDLYAKLAEAQVLKSSKRTLQKAKSQEILLEIVEDEPVIFELYVTAIYNLCDLLLLELRFTGEDEVLYEIQKLVERLQQHAEEQQAYSILTETYLIQSKLAILELNFRKADELIRDAEQIAQDNNLEQLVIKVSRNYDDLLDQASRLQQLIGDNESYSELIDNIQLEDLFLQRSMDPKKMQFQSEKASMFLIMNEGGVNLYKRSFTKDTSLNQELLSGLLTALHTLSDEVFRTKSGYQRIRHGEYMILIKSIDNLLFTYIFLGDSYFASKKLDRIIDSIKNSSLIWDALSRDISQLTSSESSGMDIIVDSILS